MKRIRLLDPDGNLVTEHNVVMTNENPADHSSLRPQVIIWNDRIFSLESFGGDTPPEFQELEPGMVGRLPLEVDLTQP